MRKTPICVAVLVLASSALAQQSASYNISDSSFGSGGTHLLTSTNYRVSFVSIGAPATGDEMTSSSYLMDGGFTSCFPPPGEIADLSFTDDQTLEWQPDPSIGHYNLYRDLMSNLLGLGYGNCEQPRLAAATTTDSDLPPAEDGYFYLVTAVNRLAEEGTKGWDSSNAERPNPDPCP